MIGQLWRVTSHYFCAGVVISGDFWVATAPILAWGRRYTPDAFLRKCLERGWDVELVA